jgi:hypothetical protein
MDGFDVDGSHDEAYNADESDGDGYASVGSYINADTYGPAGGMPYASDYRTARDFLSQAPSFLASAGFWGSSTSHHQNATPHTLTPS